MDMVSTQQIAERLQVHDSTVRGWRMRGLMPEPDVTLGPRRLLWDWATISAWDQAGRPAPGASCEPAEGEDATGSGDWGA